jgi:hypothetical protein
MVRCSRPTCALLYSPIQSDRTKCKHAQSTQRYPMLQRVLGPLADPVLVRSLSMRLRRKAADTGRVALETTSDIVARLLMTFDLASAPVPAMTEDSLHDSVSSSRSSLAAIFDVEAAAVALRSKTGYVSFSAVEGLGSPMSEDDL